MYPSLAKICRPYIRNTQYEKNYNEHSQIHANHDPEDEFNSGFAVANDVYRYRLDLARWNIHYTGGSHHVFPEHFVYIEW